MNDRRHGEGGGDEGERHPAERGRGDRDRDPEVPARTSYACTPLPVDKGSSAVTTLTDRTRSAGQTT